MHSSLVEIRRIDPASPYREIKDPSIVRMPDGQYMMFASVGRSDVQSWIIGRFTASHPRGPWQEIEPVKLEGVEGSEVCAPAVILREKDGKPYWKMYVQTTCFQPGGVIALAVSEDGVHFTGMPDAVAKPEDVPVTPGKPVIGLYDASHADIVWNGTAYETLLYSGYRRVGCGDIYMSLRPEEGAEDQWSTPTLALAQEDVPFHNHPDYEYFEWGLEGAKPLQIEDNLFVMIGVCFLEKDAGNNGKRQRVFLAASESPLGPYLPMTTPLEPTQYEAGQGENGHPDTVDFGDSIAIVYQERAGEGQPWHLRYTEIDKAELGRMAKIRIAANAPVVQQASSKPFQPG